MPAHVVSRHYRQSHQLAPRPSLRARLTPSQWMDAPPNRSMHTPALSSAAPPSCDGRPMPTNRHKRLSRCSGMVVVDHPSPHVPVYWNTPHLIESRRRKPSSPGAARPVDKRVRTRAQVDCRRTAPKHPFAPLTVAPSPSLRAPPRALAHLDDAPSKTSYAELSPSAPSRCTSSTRPRG